MLVRTKTNGTDDSFRKHVVYRLPYALVKNYSFPQEIVENKINIELQLKCYELQKELSSYNCNVTNYKWNHGIKIRCFNLHQ